MEKSSSIKNIETNTEQPVQCLVPSPTWYETRVHVDSTMVAQQITETQQLPTITKAQSNDIVMVTDTRIKIGTI